MIVKTDPRNIIIIIMVIILFFLLDGCSHIANFLEGEDVVSEETTTKTSYEVKDRSFQDIKPMPDYFKPSPQRIIIKQGVVKEVPDNQPDPPENEPGFEIVNKYSDSVSFPNGTILYDMLVRGNLLSTDFTLNTKDSIKTVEKETIRTVVKSGLYGFGGTALGLDGRPKDIQTGVTYFHKGKWYAETGLQYDVDPKIELPIQDRAGILLKLGFNF